MKALFCGGSPGRGSWIVRGEQIAATHKQWLAVNDPSIAQIEEADVIVIVKKAKDGLIHHVSCRNKPVIWDALDFWAQPGDSANNVTEARQLALRWTGKLNPVAIIAANQQMAYDLAGMADAVLCIYHHSNPALPVPRATTAREIVYEGNPRFPGRWLKEAAEISLHYGMTARTGMPDMHTRALLAARDGAHAGWLERRWKSNIKAANAIGMGVPFIAWPETSYTEVMPDGQALWFEDTYQLKNAIEKVASEDVFLSARIAAESVRESFSLASIAREYKQLFDMVV